MKLQISIMILVSLMCLTAIAEGDKHKDHDVHTEHNDHKEHDDHEGHGGGKAVGEGKAIEVVDETKGFKLSDEATSSLKIKLETVSGSEFEIKKSTLVASKSLRGVYRYREGFFKFLEVKIKKEIGDSYVISVEGMKFGDQIVVDGLSLVRVSDIYSTDKSEYGHGH